MRCDARDSIDCGRKQRVCVCVCVDVDVELPRESAAADERSGTAALGGMAKAAAAGSTVGGSPSQGGSGSFPGVGRRASERGRGEAGRCLLGTALVAARARGMIRSSHVSGGCAQRLTGTVRTRRRCGRRGGATQRAVERAGVTRAGEPRP